MGCIGAIAITDPDSLVNARVNVRLISLANCPEEFSVQLTRAANTQNRIERRDFAALDPEQERLRRDLSLDLKKSYFYKSGDTPGKPQDGCTIEETTVALACANTDVALAVHAKREVGKLWEDVTKAPYKILFNNGLSAVRMWRLVEVMREIDQALKKEQSTRKGRDRMITVHGKSLYPTPCLSTFGYTEFDNPAKSIAKILKLIPGETTKCVNTVIAQVDKHYPVAYTNSCSRMRPSVSR